MSFAIATFNAENLDFSPGFDRRLSALRPQLQRLRADVLCLQEVNAPRTSPQGARAFAPLDELLRNTPYGAYQRATSTRPGSSEPANVHNLAVLSRFPILEVRQLHHDLMPAWDWLPPGEASPVRAQFDRPILYVRARTESGLLHVLNLHLRAPRAAHLPREKEAGRWTSSAGWAKGMYLAAQLRQAQALEARLFVEEIFDADPQARIVVCGDFNADSYETPTRILCGAADDLDTSAFAARRLERLEARIEPARRHTVIHAGRRILLDHILASPALARDCTQVEIFNEGLIDEAMAPVDVEGSLHAPMTARFT